MDFITIIKNNKKGLIAEISELLEKHNINILEFQAQSDADTAGIRFTTSNYDKALAVLTESGYKVISYQNILVKGANKPGVLAQISRQLSDSDVDIRSITVVHQQNDDYSIIAITTDNNDKARKILNDILVYKLL